ncbi:MAG: hypothetical protein NTV94_08025, partial [Planctomycetota bacterium]|nr:hypothetical protein [Planctomycetota bacterium]
MATAAGNPVKKNSAGSGMLLPEWILRLRQYRGYVVPISFILMLVVLLVPMPPVLMDILIALNISLSIIILMTT